MADTNVSSMGVGRRAPRNIKLEKPAPLKRSISLDAATVSTQNHATESNTIPTPVFDEKENVFLGLRAPRRTNLKKPLPRSKSISEEKCESQSALTNINSGNQEHVYENQSVIHISGNQEAGMTPNSARRMADHVIDDVLSDLHQKSSRCVKPRLKSQVSVDSGVGDCNNNGSGSSPNVGRNNSLIDVLPDEGFIEYPEDNVTIEEKLKAPFKSPFSRCEIIREPISPYTVPTGENEDTTGGIKLLAANGRRRMFKTYKDSCLDVSDQNKKLILYSADELLQIGASPLSQQPPESWAYLVHVLPGICLSKVDKYLDTEMYQQERGYVVECHFVRSNSKQHDREFKADNGPFSKPFTGQFSTSATTRSGVSRPCGGFGLPSKNKMTLDHEEYDPVIDELNRVYPGNRKGSHFPNKDTYKRTVKLERRNFNEDKTSSEKRGQTERYVFHGKEGLLTVHAKNVDLDTKCDVSARFSRGAVKLFAVARDQLELNSRQREHDLPVVQEEKSALFEPQENVRLPLEQVRNARRVAYFEEDFYLNNDLPEQCPW